MKFEAIASGLGFLEGPVAMNDGRIAVTSIDRGQVLVMERDGNGIAQRATTGGGPNGAAEGPGGTLFIAQNGGKQPAKRGGLVDTGGVQAVGPDGTVTWVTRDPVSPNDLCIGPDGLIYITDPTRPRSRADGRLWRCNPADSEAELLTSIPWYPNGIGFGPEDDVLYVASTDEKRIVRFPLGGSGLGKPETFVHMEEHGPDGFAFDREGNIIIAGVGLHGGAGNIEVWSSEGELLDKFQPGEDVFYTNVALFDDGGMIVTSSGRGEILATPPGSFRPLPLHPFRSG